MYIVMKVSIKTVYFVVSEQNGGFLTLALLNDLDKDERIKSCTRKKPNGRNGASNLGQ